MKRRIMSLITSLALCLSLCPTWASATDREPDTNLCSHHRVHTEECGYVPEDAGAPCTYVCWICPIEDLTGKLPPSVTPDNKSQVEDQLSAILALYTELTDDEQSQLDLSRCFDLQAQLDAANTPVLIQSQIYDLPEPRTVTVPLEVSIDLVFDTHEYSFTATKTSAIVVKDGGKLYLKGSLVKSEKGAGVEIQSGGTLIIDDPNLTVHGATYGLNVASGAKVELSGGKFFGKKRAILVADNNFSALLKEGYAFFDESGNLLTDVEAAGTVIVKANPSIKWDSSNPVTVDYTGSPVEASKLPVKITLPEELGQPEFDYFYKKKGEDDSAYTKGLPTNAGTYDIVVRLPETQNYSAVSSTPITLNINKISAVIAAPTAKTLTYNREPQELVTAGVLKQGAIDEGAVIEFARAQGGPYSTDIPTGITVSDYNVYYRVADTENYSGQSGQLSARINHREIKPTVELSYYTVLYDGGDKEPTVTVKDGDAIIPKNEYTVGYSNNKNVGTATVTVNNASNGNYRLTTATATFKITLKTQDALSIDSKPNTVTYGDVFTLSTNGGSGNGNVTWKITSTGNVATVDPNSGQVTIIGDGSATVQATKSGTYNGVKNYEDAIATWTFTSVKKPVVATVTAENKIYDGKKDATVNAVVEQGIVSGDEITISGLTGTFDNENAGTNKTVAVSGTPQITGNNSQHYSVTLSSTSVKADITKAETNIGTPPTPETLTYNRSEQALVTAGASNIAGIPLEYALSESGPYSEDVPKATNAGSYEVWYRVPETDNYFGTAAKKADVTINRKTVNPTVELNPGSYEYDGAAKEPAVTVKDGEDVIPASEYTVAYSNNVNVGTTAAVTVTAKADGNYNFSVTKYFAITQQKAQVVTAPEPINLLVFADRAQNLVTPGTASGGTMVYSVDNQNGPYAPGTPTAKDAGTYTVHYKVKGDDNHSDSDEYSVTVTIGPKPVNNPTIKLTIDGTTPVSNYPYDGNAKEPKVEVMDGSTVINADEYNVVYYNNTDAGEATVYINDNAGGNYTVTGTAKFLIDKANITLTAPTAANLTYTGKPQELLNGSPFNGGTILYSLRQNGTYTDAIPTATDAGTYTVWYQVVGDKNHNDLAPKSAPEVTIGRKPLNTPIIELTPNAFEYDGKEHMPAVTVKDGNTVLPSSEYTVNYPADPKNEGTYTITISDAADGNYDLTGVTTTADFAIGKAPQAELVIDHKDVVTTNYGDTFTLTATGGSGDGAVTWSVSGSAATVNAATGAVEIIGVGEVTITATKAAAGNYFEAKANWSFTAMPKPVEATVTVKNKVYDGKISAEINTIQVPVLSGGNNVTVSGLIATFEDANVGAGKTVTLDSSKVKVDGDDAAKYAVSYPDTATADITQATTTITALAAKENLTYNGQPQELVTPGTANFGDVVYSLNGTNFSTAIPTGTNAGTYTVSYKVVGNANYTDATGTPITVTIGPKSITPTVEAKPSSYVYDGAKKEPAITVKDGSTVLDSDQYTISWGSSDWTSVGTHEATITSAGKNYTFTAATATVEIVSAVQDALHITGKPNIVYYGDTIQLGTTGGVGNGTVAWSVVAGSAETGYSDGQFNITGTGSITVKAVRTPAEGSGYAAIEDTWQFYAYPKQVTVTVALSTTSCVYNGAEQTPAVTVTANDGTVLSSSDYEAIYSNNINAGTATVTVTSKAGSNYTFEQVSEDFTIEKATPNITIADSPLSATSEQKLGDISLDGCWTAKIDGVENVPGKLKWVNGSALLSPPKDSYKAKFIPDDTDNYNTVVIQVPVTITDPSTPEPTPDDGGEPDNSDDNSGGSSTPADNTPAESEPNTVTASMPANVQNSTATSVMSAAAGEKLVKDAAANQSKNVIIKPEITGNVTKTEVSIPASTVSQLKSETNAALTVSTPIADVTIPNEALDTLSSAGGSLKTVTEQEDNTVTLTLTAGGKTVESVPGGVTLTVPVEDATPGTVAVLLHDDGTRETIRKSVAENGELSIPLDGSATVEIVDNSKDFADVPAENWAADAVAFASAHELFNGTSETTFSPDQPMSRGMLATVLYNLEGQPDQDSAITFSDVNSDAWYAAGVTWAAENGITNGYSDGQFAPNQSITREQFAVMLWRYAGSPAADDQTLKFTDADKASDYTMEALRWATENGILNGYGDGQLKPDGLATRAQAAQMLKNFMENV